MIVVLQLGGRHAECGVRRHDVPVQHVSFLVVIANCASLVIDPHREIAGFASSAYGFFTQITASVLAILTVPLFGGELLPWSLTLLVVTACVLVLVVVYGTPQGQREL